MKFFIGHWRFSYKNGQLSRLSGLQAPEVIAEGEISFGRFDTNKDLGSENPTVIDSSPKIGLKVFIKNGDKYTYISDQNITCVITN